MKKIFISFLFILACQKEIDISEFSGDYLEYEPELRIEGVIMPTDLTAIVRIDRSFLITDSELYDCRDNDFGTISLDDCNMVNGIWHGEEGVDLVADCGNWDIMIHDIGADGISSIGEDDIEADIDGSEGNGKPDCGEPNVDNYVEILPDIHIEDCDVSIMKNKAGEIDSCEMQFSENAGSFFYENFNGPKSSPLLHDIESINYGAYVPINCPNTFFTDYEAEYDLNCDCSEIGYGNIISKEPITLSRPAVFAAKDDSISIFNCTIQECLLENSTLYNEMAYDTIYFSRGSIDSYLHYVTFAPNVFFQAVQFMYDEKNNTYKYYHGHPDIGYSINENNSTISNFINWMQEPIVTEFYDGVGNGIWDEGEIFSDENQDGIWSDDEFFIDEGDKKGDVNIYSYKIFTFSESYKKYYFHDKLYLNDPVRSNLRDDDDLPIMGAFGSLTSAEIIFRIIDCGIFENSQDCENPSISKSVCEWHENPPLSDFGHTEGEPYCLPINWFD